MFKSKKPVPHLGALGINSPGYAPRKGTPQHAEAEQWTKQYHEWLASTIGKGDKN
jgi:hypothetical protein